MINIDILIFFKEYNIMMIKKVDVRIVHEDCWTYSMPYNAYTLNLQVYPHKDYLRSRILIDTADKEAIKMMKNHKSVVKVVNINRFKDGYYVDFLNTYKGSVAGVLYDKEVLILGNKITENAEMWSFVTHNKNIHEIVEELKTLGKIEEVKVQDFNPLLNPGLTDMERKVLLLALNKGYLDYPRRVSADDIARLLNISKVTFLYHLRNAQKKIINYLLKVAY
ncbi:helix-turn-helix domain-containing protein [Sulfurisphaera javensis]|uniref:Helix-turn-helix domain-containing protein n=1 Tax=Sulfurisphaera javensis TaxID=2049879 RepID=A0AAT9GSE0_9CREN